MSEQQYVATWRIVLAVILDFLTAFIVLAVVIGIATGSTYSERTEDSLSVGVDLSTGPTLLLISGMVLYFWGFKKLFGARIWERILKAQRQNPKN